MISIVRTVPGGFRAAVEATGYRVSGREAHGPCPVDGGHDRAWLAPHRGGGDRIVLTCRRCESAFSLRCAAGQILGAEPGRPGTLPDWSPPKARPAPDPKPDRIRTARRLWAAAHGADGTPAAAYLRSRGWAGPIPPAVRWLRSISGPMRPPTGAAGAVVYAFGIPGAGLMAVQLDALDAAGRLAVPRWRRTQGAPMGAAFPVRNSPGGAAVVAEGPVSALAAAILFPESRAVFAAGGTAMFGRLALREAPRRARLILAADDDRAGRAAAREATAAVVAAGFDRPDLWRPDAPGDDPADALQRAMAAPPGA